MKLIHFINLIRWKNLLLLLLIQVLLKFVLFPKFNISFAIDTFHFFILSSATLLITAGGYIINDYYDIKTDAINKPNKAIVENFISKRTSIFFYVSITLIGLFLGIYISFYIDLPILSFLFVLVATTLFFYSSIFKRIALIGNITVALLIALSIILIPIFDVIPVLNDKQIVEQLLLIKIVLIYSCFAFFINLIREIIKDIEDVDGDYSQGMKTLPIILGKKRTIKFTVFLTVLYTILVVFTLALNQNINKYLLLYGIMTITIPLIIFLVKLNGAESKKAFSKLSSLLKIIMLTGILTILFI